MYVYTYIYIYVYSCIYTYVYIRLLPARAPLTLRVQGLGILVWGWHARERGLLPASSAWGGGGGGTQATCLEHVCCTRVSLYFPVTCNPSRAVTLPNIATSEFPTELPTHTTCAGRARGGGLLPATLPASSGFVLGFEVEG